MSPDVVPAEQSMKEDLGKILEARSSSASAQITLQLVDPLFKSSIGLVQESVHRFVILEGKEGHGTAVIGHQISSDQFKMSLDLLEFLHDRRFIFLDYSQVLSVCSHPVEHGAEVPTDGCDVICIKKAKF